MMWLQKMVGQKKIFPRRLLVLLLDPGMEKNLNPGSGIKIPDP
jgi:hypothetical protein